jgi:hypothetical protein
MVVHTKRSSFDDDELTSVPFLGPSGVFQLLVDHISLPGGEFVSQSISAVDRARAKVTADILGSVNRARAIVNDNEGREVAKGVHMTAWFCLDKTEYFPHNLEQLRDDVQELVAEFIHAMQAEDARVAFTWLSTIPKRKDDWMAMTSVKMAAPVDSELFHRVQSDDCDIELCLGFLAFKQEDAKKFVTSSWDQLTPGADPLAPRATVAGRPRRIIQPT